MKRTARQIKAEIRALQDELANMGSEPDEERLDEFHTFCVEHFGRRLKVGDILEKNIMVYPPGEKAHKTKLRVEVIEPVANWETHDDVARMYWGHVNIDIKYLTADTYDGARKGYINTITKTEVRKFKLAE